MNYKIFFVFKILVIYVYITSNNSELHGVVKSFNNRTVSVYTFD